eukprot:475857-Amorphochlora_amoeboformis.AAC.1
MLNNLTADPLLLGPDCEIQPETTAKAQEIEGEEPKKYYYFFSKLSDIPSLANDVGYDLSVF